MVLSAAAPWARDSASSSGPSGCRFALWRAELETNAIHRVAIDAQPLVLNQGFGDHAYSGGDSFDSPEFWATFFPDASGTVRYLNSWGYDGYFVAERVEPLP